MSNNKEVLSSIPEKEWAKGIKDMDLDSGTLPIERALGVTWNTEADVFSIKIKKKEPTNTRRGLLSIMSSVYDPLVQLFYKRKSLCRMNAGREKDGTSQWRSQM